MRKLGLLSYVVLAILAIGAVAMVVYLTSTPGWDVGMGGSVFKRG